MKKITLFLAFLFLGLNYFYAQVGIDTDNPDPSAMMDVVSSDKGFLPPRMTSQQRDAIIAPAKALTIFNLDEKCLEVNQGDAITPDWQCMGDQTITVVLDDASLLGDFTTGIPLDGTQKVVITLTNAGTSDEDLAFDPADVTIPGTSGLTISSVSPTTTTLSPGDSIVVEYTMSGTPATSGALPLEWNNDNLSATLSANIAPGNATFSTLPITLDVLSMRISEVSLDTNDDIQGSIDNSANQFTIEIPYTDGVGTYEAFEGTYVLNNPGTGENMDSNSFRLTYPAGTFSSTGTITVTVEVDGDGSFNADMQSPTAGAPRETIATLDFQVNGNSKGNINLDVFGGVLDRRFLESTDHEFIYIPKQYADGNKWLNTNLGTEYSRLGGPQFDPNLSLEGTSGINRYAAGSQFQWGRYSDGHELVNSPTETGNISYVSGTTTTKATTDTPTTSEFIRGGTFPSDWRNPKNDNLWQGVDGVNNPCPVGFRVPTSIELQGLLDSEDARDLDSALSALNMGFNGNRNFGTGGVSNAPSGSFYATSTIAGDFVEALSMARTRDYIVTSNTRRSQGGLVRCIED